MEVYSLSATLPTVMVHFPPGNFNSKFLVYWNMNYQEYIEIRSDKRFGRPCIKGTRITVYDVLNWMSNGMTKQEIISDFEELNEDMINACLAFAADKEHKLKIAS